MCVSVVYVTFSCISEFEEEEKTRYWSECWGGEIRFDNEVLDFIIIISIIGMIQMNNNADHSSEASMKQIFLIFVASDKHYYSIQCETEKEIVTFSIDRIHRIA